MASIKIDNGKLHLDKETLSLISGEFHYWRIDPLYWDRILDTIEEMGLQFIATYISWDFHLTEQGELDFEGKTNPRRNLKAFLDLTQKRGFKLFIRPGPYIYSEWKNLGIPDEAAKHHRFSSSFLDLAKPYMKEVASVLKPYLYTHGGHIVLFQPDNEMDLMSGGFETELGLNGKDGPYQSFLEEKYKTVEALNKHWGSAYSSFKGIPAVTSWQGRDKGLWRRYYDYRLFCHDYTNQAASWMVKEYQKLGMDVPFTLNTYSEFQVQNWRELESIVDVVGVDVYPENEFLEGEQSHQLFMERLRVLPTYSKLPYIAEFESGLWHGFIERVKNPTARHYKLCALSALASGVVGWNWYMLVNRDNWYQAPITELGDWRLPLEKVFKEMVQMVRYLDPAENKKVCDVGVAFSYAHYRMGKGYQPDLILKSLYEADIDYHFIDLGQPIKESPPILFYSGEDWLSKEEAKHLVEYVEQGGTLVCFKTFPQYNEDLDEANLFDLLLPEAVLGGREVMSDKKQVAVSWKDQKESVVQSELFVYPSSSKGEPIWANQGPVLTWELQWKQVEGEKYCVGHAFKYGKGKVIQLGFDPNPQALKDLIDVEGVVIASQSQTAKVQSALYQGKSKKDFFLIMTNNSLESKETKIALSKTLGSIDSIETFAGAKVDVLHREEGFELFLSLDAKSGDIVHFKANPL